MEDLGNAQNRLQKAFEKFTFDNGDIVLKIQKKLID